MNSTQQLEYLKRNFECVNIRWVTTRCVYRLAMGKFDTNQYVHAQPFIGISDYWTIDATEESIAIAAAVRDIKLGLMHLCGIQLKIYLGKKCSKTKN